MRVRAVVRLTVALQAFLLIATLLLPALAYAEEPVDPSTPPTPTEQPSDPPAPDPTAEPSTPDPTAPPASEPDPTAPPAPDPTAPVEPAAAPTIASDLEDYPPGGLVTLTGSNWAPGESVHIYVNDELGSTWSRRVDVIADGHGDIYDQFNLPNWFVSDYVVIATGAASGMALWAFTDSQPQSIVVGTPHAVTVTAGNAASYGNVTASFNGNSNACTVTYSAFDQGVADTGLHASITQTFTATSSIPPANFSGSNPMTWNGGVGSAVLTFTLGTTSLTPPGTYTFHVRVTRGAGCQGTAGTSEQYATQLSITVNAPADTTVNQPSLLAPANGSITSDTTPTFDWTDVSDPSTPVTYRMQYVAKDATCDFTSATTTGVLSSSTFTPGASIGGDGLYCWRAKALDNLGNDSGYTPPFEFRLDTVKPVITATATKTDATPYVAGTWTNQSVTVSFSCADTGGSGLATNTVGGGGTQSAETATGSFTNTGVCTDNAGNTANPVTFSPIKIDKTAPVISSSAQNADSSPYLAGTWTNQSVSVSFTCADTGSVQSGIATDTVSGDNQTLNAETSGTNVSSDGLCVDAAGNSDTAATFGPVQIDKTAPVISSSATNADSSPYLAGTWTNQSVSVSFSCADAGAIQSGIATNTVAGDNETVSGETLGTNVSSDGLCVDAAGNSDTSETFGPVKIDKTAPVISSSAANADSSPYLAGTWTNQDVTVSFSCADTGLVQSGIVTDTVSGDDETLTAETSGTNVSSDGLCVDAAGNSDTSETFGPVQIDKTAPVITATATNADASPYLAGTWTNQSVTVSFSCSDTLSGLATNTVGGGGTEHGDTATGSFTNTGACTDNAGNAAASNTFAPIMVDKTGPVITATATKTDATPYVAGTWTNQSVTVSFSCADTGGSGLATNTVGGGGTQSAETATGSFTNTGVCTDNAGNTANPVTFSPIKIDKTAPVISSSAQNADSSPYLAGTWTNQSVSVSFTCADTGSVQSGIATDTVSGDNQTLNAETSGTNVSSDGLCVDAAGNSDTAATFGPVQIDKTAPVISSSATNADSSPYLAGTWTNQSVSVSFSCADAGAIQSGIATNTVAGDNETVSGETTGTNVSSDGDCIDAAGNSDSSETFGPVKIDKTAPVISSSAQNADSSPYLAGTWTNQSVSVSFTCADTGSVQSGIATDTVSGDNQTLNAETSGTNVSSDGLCVDAAGNSDTAATFGPVQIDKTAPVISSSATNADSSPYLAGTWTNQSVSVSFSCADAGAIQSGIATNTVAGDNETVSGETLGTNVSSDGLCVDAAGNSDTSETFGPVKIDKTAPVISSSAANADSSPYLAGTWTNQDVTVSFSCADTGLVQSGIVTDTVSGDDETLTAETSGTNVSSDGLCVDAAGNSDTSETFGPVQIDKTAPVISGVASPAANGNGWNNTDVSVSFSCADTGSVQSGIDIDTVAADNDTLTAEGENQSVSSDGDCVDDAGNAAATPVTVGGINIDKTAPVISGVASPAANGNGWNNTDVSVSFSCADTGSVQSGIDIDTVAADNDTLTAEGENQSVSSDGDCVDDAGNAAATPVTVGGINIDKTAPVISSSAANGDSSPYLAGTWTNQDVTVSFSCADTGSVQSGVDVDTVSGDNQTLTAETLGTNVSSDGDCVDEAGNADSSETFGPVKIDKTAPVITGAATPAANGNGWNNTNVSVTFTCADQGLVQSGIDVDTVAGDNQTLTAETSGTNVSSNGDCVDDAGNVAATPVTVGPIKIDKTAPVIFGIASPAANVNGWNSTTVSVSFTCVDTGPVQSGIVTDTVSGDNQTLTAETTGTTVTSNGDCVDAAGNDDTSASVGPIKIDKTNPLVAITSHPASGFVTVASTIVVSGTASDTPSGIDTVTVNGGPPAVLGIGTFSSFVNLACGANTITALATDKSGRTTTSSPVVVTRACAGTLQYYQPIDQSIGSNLIVNTGKFGRVIPVKVTGTLVLGGSPVAMTESVLNANGLTLRIGVNLTTCANGATSDGVEAYADAGAANDNTNMFRWSTSQWIYNLDTGKAPSVVMAINSCYRLDVRLTDTHGSSVLLSSGPAGTNPYAVFKPTK